MPPSEARLHEAALLLAGHGSSKVAGGGESVRLQADILARRNLFAETRAAFLREPPLLSEVRTAWRDLDVSDIYIVPMFTCRGFICDTLVPRALGLTGRVTVERQGGRERRYLLCDPVGDNPGVIGLVAARIEAMLAGFRLAAEETSILLVAHGTPRDPQSFRQTQRAAAALQEEGRTMGVLDVQTAFLEQAPCIAEGLAACRRPDVLVIPHMIAAGSHGVVDVPRGLGLDPEDARLKAVAASGHAGPFPVGGRRLYVGRAFGHEPGLADLILAQITGFRP